MPSRKSSKQSSDSNPSAKGFKFEARDRSGSKNQSGPKNQSGSKSDKTRKPKVTKQAARGDRARNRQAKAARNQSSTEASNYIPPEVSQRMVRRVTCMAGVPSTLGVSAFFINYYLLVNHILALPSWVTFVETLSLFGIGFVGITYGVLSASWEPERDGSWVGFEEFRFNVALLFQQWREYRQAQRQASTEGE